MKTAHRPPMRLAGAVAALALTLAGPAAPAASAEPAETPSLTAPEDGAAVHLPYEVFVTLPDEGWMRVQMATDASFAPAWLACDSGWYHSGFHTTSAWTLPGTMGYSDVTCDLPAGSYRWRAAYGGPTGAVPPSDPEWSAAAAFSVLADPAPEPAPPPPPPPDEPDEDYAEEEEAACAEDGTDDPDGGDPGEVEFFSDTVEATEEEAAIGTPPAEGAVFGTGETDASTADASDEELRAAAELDESRATTCSGSLIRRWVAVTEFHVALGFDGTFSYEDGQETQTEIVVKLPGQSWGIGGWKREATLRGARWIWPQRGPFHRRMAAQYIYRRHAICTKAGCRIWWAPHHWTGRLRAGAIRIQTTGWNNPYKFRLPHDHTWVKWKGTNKTMEKATSISGVSLRAQAGYSHITRIAWKSTRRCRDNWIDPIDTDAALARLIYTWSDRC